jgi:hypothetical protein
MTSKARGSSDNSNKLPECGDPRPRPEEARA